MSGSFWKFSNGFTSLSNITTLLENYNLNQEQNDTLSVDTNKGEDEQREVLVKLLDENDLLQELLSNNPMLLEFLRNEHVLTMLVDIVISNDFEVRDIEDKEERKEDLVKSTSNKADTPKEGNEKDSSKNDTKDDDEEPTPKVSGDFDDLDDQDEEGEEELPEERSEERRVGKECRL